VAGREPSNLDLATAFPALQTVSLIGDPLAGPEALKIGGCLQSVSILSKSQGFATNALSNTEVAQLFSDAAHTRLSRVTLYFNPSGRAKAQSSQIDCKVIFNGEQEDLCMELCGMRGTSERYFALSDCGNERDHSWTWIDIKNEMALH